MNKNKLILGTAQFGLDYGINNNFGKPDQSKVYEMLEYAKNNGINTLDTADAYGDAIKVIGSFSKHNPAVFAINTKFKRNNLSLAEQLAITLDSLNIKQINTYFYHTFSDFIIYPSLIDQLLELKNKNYIKKIGISIYEEDELKVAIHNQSIDVIQLPFNLLDNFSQKGNFLREAKSSGKEIQARSIFMQGLFFMDLSNIPNMLFPLVKYLSEIKQLCKRHSTPIELLALQYVAQQIFIDQVIIGVDNLNQLKRNIQLIRTKLPRTILRQIDDIFVKEIELLYPKNWN